MITIVKIGGNVIDDENSLENFLAQFAAIEGPKLLVHGGGKLATTLASRLGVETEMINGRRVTGEEMLKVITMTYAGWVNKLIVAKLNSKGINALGLSGADGNFMRSEKRGTTPVDFGYVGDPLENGVNVKLLSVLFDNNITPVVAPVTHNGEGQLLNTNADTIAATIAASMAKTTGVQLIFCFEKKGVLSDAADDESVIRELTEKEAGNLSATGQISKGMLPKINAGFYARKNGAARVVIGHAELLQKIAAGNKTCTLLSE